jgi:hypothetical protein
MTDAVTVLPIVTYDDAVIIPPTVPFDSISVDGKANGSHAGETGVTGMP